jgi:hypothetical protein
MLVACLLWTSPFPTTTHSSPRGCSSRRRSTTPTSTATVASAWIFSRTSGHLPSPSRKFCSSFSQCWYLLTVTIQFLRTLGSSTTKIGRHLIRWRWSGRESTPCKVERSSQTTALTDVACFSRTFNSQPATPFSPKLRFATKINHPDAGPDDPFVLDFARLIDIHLVIERVNGPDSTPPDKSKLPLQRALDLPAWQRSRVMRMTHYFPQPFHHILLRLRHHFLVKGTYSTCKNRKILSNGPQTSSD